MLITETFAVAFASLRANKMRSLLTMLGIVIGVGAVIAVIALGNGAQSAVADRIARLGTTTLQINPQRVRQGGLHTAQIARLTLDDVRMIEERALSVAAVTPQQNANYQVVFRNRNTNVQITGTTPNFLLVRGYDMALGRMFSAEENQSRQRVAVLGADVPNLLGVTNAFQLLNQRVRIRGRVFTVIGVMASKGGGFGSADDEVIVPLQTARFTIFGRPRLNDIWARVASEDSIDVAMGEIQAALRRSHKIGPEGLDDFRVRNQADFLSTLSDATQTFSVLLAGIAAVSLLVGGIGIMNIMLVSVTERTREIGIRKALGATRRTILFQFIIEAVSLCLLGGVVGVLVGSGGAVILQRAFGWTTSINATAIGLSFAFSAVVGLVFGVWPARRAATLDPIVALRYE
jgi:putative ABC transport system permease protein